MRGNRMAVVENPKNYQATWSKLINYSKKYMPYVIAALIAAALSAILIIFGPNQLSAITDAISLGLTGEMDWETINNSVIRLIIYYAGSALLLFFMSFTMGTVTAKISSRMRSDISTKINNLPLSYFDNNSYGDVLSRITNDVDTIGQALNQSIGNITRALFMVSGAVVMMFITNWQLALVAIISSLIGLGLIFFIMTHSQQYFSKQQKSLGAVNGHIEEIFSNHNIVRTYNGQHDARAEFTELNEELYNNAWSAQFMSSLMQPIMMFIGNFAYVAVAIVGAIMATNGMITMGVIVAFITLVRLFTQPLNQIAQAGQNIQMATAASERVFNFLEEEELADESHKTTELTNVKGDVTFDQVSFSYDGETPVINDFSLDVKAGQQIAIVGPTGAGKTTLINLLMRFYEINSGHILIDGVDTTDITRENLHDQFGMVLQDTWLYEGSIRDNIVYNQENITDEQVEAVVKTVGLDHYIDTLPEGINTMVGERASLSEGQKQLITIARAMVKDAPLLILDEATSSVDTRTEILVQDAMTKLTEDRTSFVIAHRLSTIKDADHIIVMNHGDIIEQGNHEELLEKGEFYAELYNSQFEEVDI